MPALTALHTYQDVATLSGIMRAQSDDDPWEVTMPNIRTEADCLGEFDVGAVVVWGATLPRALRYRS